MNWYLEALKKYAMFRGRARRKEFCMFSLFNLIIAFVLGFIEGIAGILPESNFSVLPGIYILAVLTPWIALSVRRLHDTNRSGRWLVVYFIPLINLMVVFALIFHDSWPGANQYGPNPKGTTA